MRQYLTTGLGRAVGYTRIVLGLHRLGHVFPMLLSVRETTTAEDVLLFVGVMRPLTSTEQLIVLDAEHRITACTQESFSLLDLQPQVLNSSGERPKIADWIVEWNDCQDALADESGTLIHVQAPATARELQGTRTRASAERQVSSLEAGVKIQGHLQPIALPDAMTVFILHWHRVYGDSTLVSVCESVSYNVRLSVFHDSFQTVLTLNVSQRTTMVTTKAVMEAAQLPVLIVMKTRPVLTTTPRYQTDLKCRLS